MIVFETDADGLAHLSERDIPEIGPGEALVKTAACGICTSDTLGWYLKKKSPIVLGHEPAGTIVEMGSGVSPFHCGDRVFVHHHAPCLACEFCRRGRYVLCPQWRQTRLVPGGMAEFFRVPAANLSRDTLLIPPELPMEAGCLVEPFGTVVKAFARGRFSSGMSVLVIGLGVMGQMAVMLARVMGASKVFGADRVPERLQFAKRFGADALVDISHQSPREEILRWTEGRGVDFVFVGPGTLAAMEEGLACAGPGSTVLFFTMAAPGQMLAVEPYRLYFNEIDLVSSYSCGPEDTREALRLLTRESLPWRDLITHRFPITEAPAAFTKVQEARDALKVIVEFGPAA